MKKLMLLLFLTCIYSYGVVYAKNLPLLGKIIYIDPGHGGKDPGAMSGNIKESDLNLEISYKISTALEKLGATVYMTRYGDYDLSVNNTSNRKRSDLSRRVKIIDDLKPDLYLSIHLNADTSKTWKGAQVFYDDKNTDNEVLAKIMQEQFKKDLKTNREYKKITERYMYRRVKTRGILIEAGFLTNDNERYLLKTDDYQLKIATSIANGTVKYLSNN